MEIEFFGQLTEKHKNMYNMTIENSMTIAELAAKLGVDEDSVGLITINGIQSEQQDFVAENDRICFFPPMSGG